MRYSIKTFIFDLIKNNKSFVIISLLCGIFWAGTFSAVPYLLGIIIDHIKNIGSDRHTVFALLLVPAIAFVTIGENKSIKKVDSI